MNRKKFLTSIIQISISNGFLLFSGVLMGLALPILFDVSDYGYYRLFTLYTAYFGIFHLGFIDGLYLYFGGYNYYDLNFNKFKLYTKFLLILEMVIAVIVMILAFLLLNSDREFVFICLGINLFVTNLTYYYQYISQVTSRFKVISTRNIIQAVMLAILVISFLYFDISNYKYFIMAILLINIILLISYMIVYKEISFKSNLKIINEIKSITYFIKIGFPLLISNFMVVVLINLPRQIVDWIYEIKTFALFAFAYSLMNLANIFVAALTMVVYPTLKKVGTNRLKDLYNNSISLVIIVISITLVLYYPLEIFVKTYLTEYIDSLIILRVIFPSLIISSSIQIVKLNYFKVLKETKQFFMSGFYSILFLLIVSYAFYKWSQTPISMAIASIASLSFWYLVTEIYFIRLYKINPIRNILYIILVILCFYTSFLLENIYSTMVYYVIGIFVLIITIYRNKIKNIIHSFF